MIAGAIALYEEALRGPGAALVLRTADGRALPLEISRWCERPDAADEELLSAPAARSSTSDAALAG